ncbi:hypothetical protein N9Y92_00505 [Chlamydiales bacterium]|nr:hypothetical protein [Chlamydiales bacterium]
MLESLPPSIRTELEIIRRQETVALKFLPSIFTLIKRQKQTTQVIHDLEEAVSKKRRLEENDKKKAIKWIREKSDKIQTHPLANHFLIKPSLDLLNSILNLEQICLHQNHISNSLNSLKEVVCLLAGFGKDESFGNWAPVMIKNERIHLYDFNLSTIDKMTILNLNSALGKQLLKKLNRGFIDASIIPPSKQLDSIQSVIEIQYGIIEQFNIPDFVNRFYEGHSKSLKGYIDILKSNDVLLYEHLQTLSQKRPFELVISDTETLLKSQQEVDRLSIQVRPWIYLNSKENELCQKKNQTKPLDNKILVDLLETLLLMISQFYEIGSGDCQDVSEAQKSAKRKKINIDESQVKNFILDERKKNPKLSRETVVDKIIAAVAKEKLKLSRNYERSTYKKWDREVDPVKDVKSKLKRPKAKNIQ